MRETLKHAIESNQRIIAIWGEKVETAKANLVGLMKIKERAEAEEAASKAKKQ